MKKSYLLFVMSLICYGVFGQVTQNTPWLKSLNQQRNTTPIKFQEIVDAGNTFWESQDKNKKGSGYKPFKRWEYYWQNFVGADGNLPTGQQLYEAWLKNESKNNTRNTQVDNSNWQSLGPTDFTNQPYNAGNIGRVNVVIKDPNNANTLYVGAPAGGLWKTSDNGNSWSALTDDLPQIGVSGIAIDPNNSNNIYIATGDDDAGDSYSVGVWKSTDAGTSWSITGSIPMLPTLFMNDIYIHPSNSNILWVATNSGVYKTSDAGVNWTNTLSGNIRDIKINPGDPDIIYAVSSNSFYKSTDGGDSFSLISTTWPTDVSRLVIDVTPANSNVVYALSSHPNYPGTDPLDYAYEGLYKSTDSGATFVKATNTTNIFESTQSWYDMAMAVSDTNEFEVYVGVLNVWKTSNSGVSFSKLNSWSQRNAAYTHADIHFLRFYDNELYVGSDGGYFKSANGGTTFTDYTVGMEISQFYRISMGQYNASKIAGGTQDNGGFAYSNQWNNYHGGDGMESNIDPNNDNLYYGFMQRGSQLFVSDNSGQGVTSAYPGAELDSGGSGTGNWITPMVINNEGEVYAGYRKVHRFNGIDWTTVSRSNLPSNIDHMEVDPSDSNILYVAVNSQLYKSSDKGRFNNVINSFSTNITSIEVHHSNSDIIYVTTSGMNEYDDGGLVYRSIDGGNNFSDITGTLTGVTKNIIKHRPEDPLNTLFLGTNVGVYKYDDNTNDWETFNNNLPNTSVMDLDINVYDNKIVAGTYGRGIWISDLPSATLAGDDLKITAVNSPFSLNLLCDDIIPMITVKNNGTNVITDIDVEYTIDGGSPQNHLWSGSLSSLQTTSIDLPTLVLMDGDHSLLINAIITNDSFENNNKRFLSFFKNSQGTIPSINTFEDAQDDLISINLGGSTLWERGVPSGSVLNTTNSDTQVYGTDLNGNHPDQTKAYLYSNCLDLSTISSPVLKFYMAYDIEPDWDLVYVESSIDGGDNWNLLGSASDLNWYNSDRFDGDGLGSDCYNCVGGQWTGTDAAMTQYSYALDAFTSESNFMFRFVFHSDFAVNQEGVIIDDLEIAGTLLSSRDYELSSIAIYPNPSSNIFNVKLVQSADVSYQITDITGKKIIGNKVNNTSHFTINMDHLSTGIYLLTLNSEGYRTTKKLILN